MSRCVRIATRREFLATAQRLRTKILLDDIMDCNRNALAVGAQRVKQVFSIKIIYQLPFNNTSGQLYRIVELPLEKQNF
jgi:hypothetical protein